MTDRQLSLPAADEPAQLAPVARRSVSAGPGAGVAAIAPADSFPGVSKSDEHRFRSTVIEYVHSSEFENARLRSSLLVEPAGVDQPLKLSASVKKSLRTIPPYLANLYYIPLLTPEGEFFLFRKMNFLKYRAAKLQRTLRRRRPSREDLLAFDSDLAAAAEIRSRIVQSNLRLVVAIAKKLVDPANSLDDLISEGNLPLLRAVEIFDFTRGIRFSTYATWAVRNCLFRYSPKNRRQQRRFLSGGEEYYDQYPDDGVTETADRQRQLEMLQLVEQLLGTLDQRERTIVQARFGLGEPTGSAGDSHLQLSSVTNGDGELDRGQKFREIAETLQLSTERVRQLLTRAIEKLRVEIGPVEWPF